jgi:hypothetical protein
MSRIPHGQGGRCMLFLQDHRPRLCSQASVAERPIALPPVRLEERPMAQLHFTCPATRHRAATGIQIDVQSLRASWHSTLKVNCPHCGGQHDIAVRDTYMSILPSMSSCCAPRLCGSSGIRHDCNRGARRASTYAVRSLQAAEKAPRSVNRTRGLEPQALPVHPWSRRNGCALPLRRRGDSLPRTCRSCDQQRRRRRPFVPH